LSYQKTKKNLDKHHQDICRNTHANKNQPAELLFLFFAPSHTPVLMGIPLGHCLATPHTTTAQNTTLTARAHFSHNTYSTLKPHEHTPRTSDVITDRVGEDGC